LLVTLWPVLVHGQTDRPSKVLDGTEIVDLSAFPALALAPSDAGVYTAEQGGAEVRVTLHRLDDGWRVERAFAEPGMPPLVARHDARLQNGTLVAPAAGLTIRRTEEGILLHEASPDTPMDPTTWSLLVPR
jgi:hypothetical protein